MKTTRALVYVNDKGEDKTLAEGAAVPGDVPEGTLAAWLADGYVRKTRS